MKYAVLLTFLALGVSGEVFNFVNQPGQSSPLDLYSCSKPLNISLLEDRPEYEAKTWLVGVWLKFDTPVPYNSSFLTLVTRDDSFNVSFVEYLAQVELKDGSKMNAWKPYGSENNWIFVGLGGDTERSFIFLRTHDYSSDRGFHSPRSLSAPFLQIPGSCLELKGRIGTVQVIIDEPVSRAVAEKMANDTFCDLSCPGSCSAPGLQNCVVCDQTCSSCFGPTDNHCSSCKNGHPLETGGECTCPAAHYPNPTTLNCSPCASNCVSCNGPKVEDCTNKLIDFFTQFVGSFHEGFPYLSQQPNGLICYGMMQPSSCADPAYLDLLGPFEVSFNGSWTLSETQCRNYLAERWTYVDFLFDQFFPTLSIPTYQWFQYFLFVSMLRLWILRFGNHEMSKPVWQPLLALLNSPNTDWSQVYFQRPNIFEDTNKVELPPSLQTWFENDNNHEISQFLNWYKWDD